MTFEDVAVRRRWVRLPLEPIELPGQGTAWEAAGAGEVAGAGEAGGAEDVAAPGTAPPLSPRPTGLHFAEDGAGGAPAEPEYALSPGLVFGLCLKTVRAGIALRPWLGGAAGVQPGQDARDQEPGQVQAGTRPPELVSVTVTACSPQLLLRALAVSRLVSLRDAEHAAAAAAAAAAVAAAAAAPAAAAATAAACDGGSAKFAHAGARLGHSGAAQGGATGAGGGAETRGSAGLDEARRQCNAARLRCWWEVTLELVGRAVRDRLHGEEVDAWGGLGEVLGPRCLAVGVGPAGGHGAGALVPGQVEAGAGMQDMDVQEGLAVGWLPCVELLMRKAVAGEHEQDSGSGSSSGGGGSSGSGGRGGASVAG